MYFLFRKKAILIIFIFFVIPFFAQATEVEFNIDPSYDYLGRSKITTFLHQLGENAYFYVEDDFYKTLDIEKRTEFSDALKNLSQEFDSNIYPRLREVFGSEWKPGIDNDGKITVLITRIKGEAGGYFNSGDEYPKVQAPGSNEKEMVYLNANYITNPLSKSFLAHEFSHLLTFNQKEKTFGVSEEIWLNEARAEYVSTLLGYDDNYQDSNLQRRVKVFLENPRDSLTEWKNLSADYGVLNLFTQYLVDHYGVKILADSLRSEKTGIPSLNYALEKNGFSQNFSQIFTDWLLAVLVNNCNLGSKYCYLNPNLKNLQITPQLNYLPASSQTTLSVTDFTKNWSGNWSKIIGGQGTLKLEFIGDSKVSFRIPYLSKDSSGNYSLDFLKLDSSQRGMFYLPDFGGKIISLTLIPSIQSKIFGFDGLETFYQFLWTVSTINESPKTKEEEELIKKLLSQIEYLNQEIAKIQLQIAAALAKKTPSSFSCQKIENNLYFGLRNNSEVRCLQEFLRSQGPEIYPEGLVTGNFFSLTETAVKKYQASKGIIQTGYFGPLTRAAVNNEL